jgi:hypothetical protein
VSKILPRNFLENAGEYIRNNCNPLYDALFAFHFGGGGAEAVVSGLERFRNGDGGFGHGLEHDFLMPDSSPMATTVALQIFGKSESEPTRSSMMPLTTFSEASTGMPGAGGRCLRR